MPVRLDLSWFAGLAVLVLLSRELWRPARPGPAAVAWSGGFAVAFFACVLAHELAHALAARAVGVPTREIRLFVFGGVARIDGEPADAAGEALMAMAGPLASAILAGLFALAGWSCSACSCGGPPPTASGPPPAPSRSPGGPSTGSLMPCSSPPVSGRPTAASRWPTSAASASCWNAWRSSPGRSS